MKVPILRLLSALVKICQIPHVIFQTNSQFFFKVLHHSLVSWKVPLLYYFSSNIIYLGQKEPMKVQVVESFEYSGRNLSNSFCKFLKNKSVPLQIFHHSPLSLHIAPLQIFSSRIFYFWQKDPIKVLILTLPSILLEICRTSPLILQTTRQVFF